MKTQIFYIYALKCPFDGIIKYVGCSVQPELRLKIAFKGGDSAKKENKRKFEWFRFLETKGLYPELVILKECVDFEEAVEAEQKYIEEYRPTIFNGKSKILYRHNHLNR